MKIIPNDISDKDKVWYCADVYGRIPREVFGWLSERKLLGMPVQPIGLSGVTVWFGSANERLEFLLTFGGKDDLV